MCACMQLDLSLHRAINRSTTFLISEFSFSLACINVLIDHACRFGEWKQAILNHPILKDHSAEKLACYLSIHKNAQGMSRESLTNFSNALLCKIPD